jgi:hypothetical protein
MAVRVLHGASGGVSIDQSVAIEYLIASNVMVRGKDAGQFPWRVSDHLRAHG